MAVVQSVIKTALKQLYDDARAAPMDEDEFADRMATIIRNAILSADVTSSGSATGVQTGPSIAPVTTTGSLS